MDLKLGTHQGLRGVCKEFRKGSHGSLGGIQTKRKEANLRWGVLSILNTRGRVLKHQEGSETWHLEFIMQLFLGHFRALMVPRWPHDRRMRFTTTPSLKDVTACR